MDFLKRISVTEEVENAGGLQFQVKDSSTYKRVVNIESLEPRHHQTNGTLVINPSRTAIHIMKYLSVIR